MDNIRQIVLTQASTEDDIKNLLGSPLNARQDLVNLILGVHNVIKDGPSVVSPTLATS
jgi:hypothetical protein